MRSSEVTSTTTGARTETKTTASTGPSLLPDALMEGVIANNVVEHNYSKGIQVYDSDSGGGAAYVVEENTSVNKGEDGAVVLGGSKLVHEQHPLQQ